MEIAGGILDAFYMVLTVVFNKVFTPVLTDILAVFGEVVIAYMAEQFAYLAYLCLVGLCGILDGLEGMINVFVGTEKIIVDHKPMTLMEMIFQLDVVSQGFLIVTMVAVCLCLIFTVVSVARSISSMTLENKNPISHVLKSAMKAAVTFLTVPFFCIFLLQISTVLTTQVQTAVMNQTGVVGNPSTGTYVFLISSLRAGRKEPNNIGSFLSRLGDMESNYLEPDMEDELRREYLSGKKDYKSLLDSGMDFSPAKFDYIMGFVAVIFMILMFVGLIIQFIRRLLELVMLYIVSPFFVATIPADDGSMFKRWREMFVAKFLAGFGVIFALKIFLLLLPLIFSSKLNLGASVVYHKMNPADAFETVTPESQGGTDAIDQALERNGLAGLGSHSSMNDIMYSLGVDYESDSPSLEESMIDSLLKLLFMMGGVLAIYKSQTLVLEILNPQAAQDTKESMMLAVAAGMKAAKIGKEAVEAGASLALGAVSGGTGTAAMMGAKAGATAGKAAAKTAGQVMKKGAKKAVKSAAQKTKQAVGDTAGKITQGSEHDS
ncbi:MAG: hypothetical protein KH230_18410 [Enterocloster asparagiformis]|nr:hypothetical protein [Enterocloster asparagiformis]